MIRTEELTKQYGKLFAVKNLKLDLVAGDLFGFIGPNGSGKTTTMKILATLLQPTWGEAYVCDKSIYTHPKEIRRLIGYMPGKKSATKCSNWSTWATNAKRWRRVCRAA